VLRRAFSAARIPCSSVSLAIPTVMLTALLSLTGCGLVGGSGGGKPTMTVTPSAASFGNVTVKTDATQTIKVSNTGKDELKIFSADITGAGFSLSGLKTPTKLAAGASVNFNVAFKPTQSGTETGTMSLKTNADEVPATVNLSGTGVEQSIKLTASATSLNFGTVPVSKSQTQNVTITNSGNANVTIMGVTASGAGFSASGGSNVTLAPNQSVSVSVSFDPMTKGSLSGTLTVSSNAPAVTITLGGTGMQSVQAANHSVGLTWSASASPVIGYFVYRRTGTSGTFSRLDSSVDTSTSFTDSNVTDGATYFYVVTAVSAGDVESQFSTEVSVTIPGS
jgi:Abnormal spindle-like microcephaly-assoc'd, ASPM-SPD-2-Hydin